MKKISVLTATRAEYGLLKTLIMKLMNEEEVETEVVVTGAHLSPEFGLTYKEIIEDQVPIAKKIEILLSSDTPAAISKSMGLAMISFSEYFAESKPDLLIVLGDRYETLAVCCVAMNARIPIAHLHGGEITEGAIDESIRHAITKLSYLHFTSTEIYRRRVVQLGESPERVYNVGALGVENVLHTELLSKSELESSIEWKLDRPYGVVTFHPVTLEGDAEIQIKALLSVMSYYKNMQFIITKANADAEGRVINNALEEYAMKNGHVKVFDSLGMLRYLSSVKYASVVVGNSSSGIIEVPSFRIPTVNIGTRQKGRLRNISIVDCDPIESSIKTAMEKVLSIEFRDRIQNMQNLYGDGDTSYKITKIIKQYLLSEEIDIKKSFYDLGGHCDVE